MSNPTDDDMMKATRLTQAGRLKEATALLQKLLGAGVAHNGAPKSSPASKRVIDITPGAQASTSGGAGASDEAYAAFPKLVDGGLPTEPLRKLTETFSDVLQRMRTVAPSVTLPGHIKPSPPPAEIVPEIGRFIAGSFSGKTGGRSYKLYIPGRTVSGSRPLVVMLHGCTQSADDFAAGTRMNFAAEEHGCFVLYPEQTSSANASRCWNWFNTGDQKRDEGEPALIAGMTQHVMANYPIDPGRVYIAGLSAGGAAAAVLAEAYPELYAAVGVHSGLACGVARDLPSAFAAMQGRHPAPNLHSSRQNSHATQTPTIVFHGDRDSTVHPRNGAEVIARAQAGTDYDTVTESGTIDGGHAFTRSIRHDAKGRVVLEDWVIHGAGHAWSGGNSAGSFTDPRGPDATKEMLRFFLQHAVAVDERAR